MPYTDFGIRHRNVIGYIIIADIQIQGQKVEPKH